MTRAAVRALLAAVLMISFAACNTSERQEPTNTAAPAPAATSQPRSDTDVITAVQAKFYSDENMRGRDIDVSAQTGVVTLRGSVPSEQTKQQAVSLARGVEGVTQVNDELEVRQTAAATSAERDPDPAAAAGTAGRGADARQPWWITTKIQAQYFTDADVKPWNIDVTTASGGIVTLEGTVDSAQAKAEAVRIARETEGVTRVEDRLRVETDARRAGAEPSAGAPTAIAQPDAWLTAKIQAKYFMDEEVKGRNIDVDTSNGVVTLKGTVGTEAERRQAVAIARNTDGVRDVTDNLRVDTAMSDAESAATERQPTEANRAPAERATKGSPIARPDPWITTKIQAQYFLDADVKGHLIDVDTNSGVVTLKGRVETAQQKQEAEQIARETEGVTRVNNQLTVGTGA